MEATPGPEPQLLRLQSAGIPVAVVRPGDDLAEALGGRRATGCVERSRYPRPAVVLAIVWLRLESPAGRPLPALGVTVLALLPALVRPVADRLAASIVTLGGAACLAFDVSPLHPETAPGLVGHAFANGFLDFYDVRTPFDPRVHTEMRGVVLAAVFGFVLALSLAVAARRPIAAAVVLLIGAGWPATSAEMAARFSSAPRSCSGRSRFSRG